MPGPPQYIESNQQNVAALHVSNRSWQTAPLIWGYGAGGNPNPVFAVDSSGAIWSAHNLTVSDIFARGRVDFQGDLFVRGRVFALEFKVSSDKNAKENFSNVNTLEVLDNLASMPIQSWNYKEDSSSVRHIGPTAQDFHAAFGLNGDDDTRISNIDLQGVALAAIQGLNEKNEKLKAENAQLQANLASLEARLSALESKGQTE